MKIDLKKEYRNTENDFNLEVEANIVLHGINILFGASGSGKTSLLKILSGLDNNSTGFIKVKNEYWYNSNENISLPPHKRNIAYVFPEDNLFPNMTVLKNITYTHKNYNEPFLQEICSALEINNILSRKIHKLSSGQKQRAALASALIQEKEFLFLDEALSALDNKLRKSIQKFLLKLQKQKQITILMITHSIEEAVLLGDHAIILEKGKIIREGKPENTILRKTTNYINAIVLSIENNEIIVFVETQKIKISENKIKTRDFKAGDLIEIIL